MKAKKYGKKNAKKSTSKKSASKRTPQRLVHKTFVANYGNHHIKMEVLIIDGEISYYDDAPFSAFRSTKLAQRLEENLDSQISDFLGFDEMQPIAIAK